MLMQIIKNTPPWVFILFFVLIALGVSQSKGRTVKRSKVSILPGAMLVLSLYGVFSAFGMVPAGLACWVLGVAFTVGLREKVAAPHGVTFSPESQSFFVPGSWFPLVLMMAIFFVKYLVGVIVARQLPIGGDPAFVSLVSLCYGLLSGVFLARAIVTLRAAAGDRQSQA